MSIRKIVGTETELRLDLQSTTERAGDDNLSDNSRPSPTRDRWPKYYWKERDAFRWLVEEAATLANERAKFQNSPSSSVPPPLEPAHRLIDSECRAVILARNCQRGIREEIWQSVDEHQEESSWSYYSGLDHLRQRSGLSGQYTVSGFRLYVDGACPEVSTPECSSPLDLVRWEKAGEQLVIRAAEKIKQKHNENLTLYKNNSDGLGQSWGAHENYLVTSGLFETLIWQRVSLQTLVWMTFLVSRYIFAGAGKAGSETPGWEEFREDFLVSQRAEFITKQRNFHTTVDRPLINTRDVSYVGAQHGRRLHVIVGDANRCETALYLKVGTAMVVLMMLEDKWPSALSWFPVLVDPLLALRQITTDCQLRQPLAVQCGWLKRTMTAVDLQLNFWEAAQKWYEKQCLKQFPAEQVSWIPGLLAEWFRVLQQLKTEPQSLIGEVDWITVRWLCERQGRGEPDRHRALDLAYRRLGERGVYEHLLKKGLIKKLVSEEEIKRACSYPPADTRAFTRGQAILHSPHYPFFVSWDYMEERAYWLVGRAAEEKIYWPSPWKEESKDGENV